MAGLCMHVVEAFTIGNNQAFSGNTAGVCILDFDDDILDELKQSIGAQMNLAETAFVSQGWTKSKPLNSLLSNQWTIRWFTSVNETELCGHGTMAASHVIFNEIIKKQLFTKGEQHSETMITFETKFKGELQSSIDWSTGRITLNFPQNPPVPISAAFGIDAEKWIQRLVLELLGPDLPVQTVDDVQFSPGLQYFLVRLRNTGDPESNWKLLEGLKPNFKNLLELDTGTGKFKMVGVSVTVQGWTHEKCKPVFLSRMFAPWCGSDEDPVCGSAHTVLAPYWVQELRKQGRTPSASILGMHLSARKGEIECKMMGTDTDRVYLVGQSRLSLRAEFYYGRSAGPLI